MSERVHQSVLWEGGFVMSRHFKALTFAILVVAISCPYLMVGQPGSWVQTSGPIGGYIGTMIVSRLGTVIAGTEEGIHRSTNRGASWSWVSASLPNRSISAIALDSTGAVMIGTGQGVVYRSTNEGLSWQAWPGSGSSIYGFCCGDSGTLWISRWGVGIAKTTNNGTSWQSLDSGLTDKFALTLFVEKSGFCLVGTTNAIYRSTNAGVFWTIDTVGLPSCGVYSITRHSNGNLFAATNAGMFRSTNNGTSWAKVGIGSFRNVLVDTSGTIVAALFGGEVRRSTDGGNMWNSVSISPGQTVCALALSPLGDLYAGCLGLGIFRSTDHGVTWGLRQNGLVATTVNTLIRTPDNTIYAGTDGAGLFRTTNGGAAWLSDTLLASTCKIWGLARDDSGGIVAATWGWGLLRRSASGLSWNQVAYGYFYCVTTSPGGVILAGGDNGRILHSTDFGKTTVQDSVTDTGVFAVADGGHGLLYAGTFQKGVYRSSDSGKTWTQKNTGLSNFYVRSLLIREGGSILAGTDGGLFLSTDMGESWTSVTTGLFSVRALLSIGASRIVAVGWKGVSFSSDYGSTWGLVNDGLWPSEVRSIAIDNSGYLYAGMANGGVFKSVGATAVEIAASSSVPEGFALMQNYPNPFNPTTTVRFTIGGVVALSGSEGPASRVRLVVCDLLGREVAVLMNEVKDPGTFSVTFDAAQLASGVYFYRLTAGDFTATKTMLLVR
jgi:ligand-binding sensor domain-containing protein